MRVLRNTALALALLCAVPAHGDVSCNHDPRIIGACSTLHGRLRIYANLRPYLWPVGTKRLLGIALQPDLTEGNYDMPDDLAKELSLGMDIFGDFRVCPFTPEQPGRMQMVCIDSASHLKTVANSTLPPR